MIPLKVAFYTEAGTNRGMGHLLRSHTIYEELKKSIKEVDFYLDSDINFDYKFDDINYFKWNTLEIKDNYYDLIFIDSYFADIKIYEDIANSSKLAIYIDDYGRLDYPKGVILNVAPDAEELFFTKKKKDNIYLLGLEYVPIREIFLKQEIKKKDQVFISFGGNTKDEIYLDVLEAIKEINTKKVVISNSHTLVDKFKDNTDIEILYKPKDEDLIHEMANSKVAILTASMTVYELAYFKISNIIIPLAKNQEFGVPQFLKHGLSSCNISLSNSKWRTQLRKNLIDLLSHETKVNNIIDGNGSKNIINKVMKVLSK